MDTRLDDKTLNNLIQEHPLIKELLDTREVFWRNPALQKFEAVKERIDVTEPDVRDAEERLRRFATYLAKTFPETRKNGGIIESPVVRIQNMKRKIENLCKQEITGELLLKCDNQLAISGSIKARGGIYEVLKHAEELAISEGLLTIDDDYSKLDDPQFKEFFSGYSIAVGSTGNLGLSIGIISAQLGFQVNVHMSRDAKQWKKDLLRSKGVNVVEYESDYSKAVEEGRKQALSEPRTYFIDDENSKDLFFGYAVAAFRLEKQLDSMGIRICEDRPLFVYLPCGVGGGPGGVAFGLKLVFGDNAHCFFAEPTHSPCMLLGLMTGLYNQISVQDIGIDNVTDADGLAVGRPSGFVCRTMHQLISGAYTVYDQTLYGLLKAMVDAENIWLEPSALAGVAGPARLLMEEQGVSYLKKEGLAGNMGNAVHLAWATGGSMVPEHIMKQNYQKAVELQKAVE
ncbi:MAG: D-serine ammonia-lyase [Clostridiaceae bacterium]